MTKFFEFLVFAMFFGVIPSILQIIGFELNGMKGSDLVINFFRVSYFSLMNIFISLGLFVAFVTVFKGFWK